MDLVAGSLISEIAEWACQAQGRVRFRAGVLERLVSLLQLDAAAFSSVPPPAGGESVAVWNATVPSLVSLWSKEEAAFRTALRTMPRCRVSGAGEPDWSATGRDLHCCVVRVSERTPSALALSRTRPFSEDELRLLGALQPVLQLGDERQVEVDETLGAQLSPRERQIFEYLVRGFRNEDIARALGTSPATVRNQLVRLYRKAGVATRSELVGLATVRLLANGPAGGAS